MGLFDSKAPQTIQEAMMQAKAAANSARKNLANKAWDYYKGRQSTYLEQEIYELFPESKDVVINYAKLGPNMMAWIADLNSMVYKESPKRNIDDESLQEEYNAWAEKVHLDLLLDMANKRTFVERTIHLRVYNDPQLADVAIDVIGQGITDVVQHPLHPSTAYAIVYEIHAADTGGEMKTYFVYTDPERHFIFDEGDRLISPSDDNPQNINPYGRLNFVKCAYQLLTDEYFDHPSERLIDFQTGTNLAETQMEFIATHQAFAVPFLTNWQGKQEPILSPTRPLVFHSDLDGREGRLEFATPKPMLMELWTILKDKRAECANEHNIDPMALRIDGSAPSGEALKASARRLMDERQRQIKFWNLYEKQIFDLYKQSRFLRGDSVNMNATIQIEFGEIGFEKTMEELERSFALQRQYLLASPLDVYRQFNPQDSRTDDEILEDQEEMDRAWKAIESRFARVNFRRTAAEETTEPTA